MLLLTESEVLQLFPMERALERVESSFVQQHGGAVNRCRQRVFLPHTSLHYMAASLPEEKLVGMKIYTIAREAWRFVVLLFDGESGAPLALMEADHLGRIRTGAASGVATRYLAREDASRVGMIGAGRQAETQLEAVARVRNLKAARVFSRAEAPLRDFCRRMTERLHLEVQPAQSAQAAAEFGDIVITATSASQPVVQGDWLRPGAHVNAIGANMLNRRELDDRALVRAGVIAVDSLEQAKLEAGDLVYGLRNALGGWEGVVELHDIMAGSRRGRSSEDEITLFKSSGIALWDVAAAGYIYRRGLEQGKGRQLQMWGEES